MSYNFPMDVPKAISKLEHDLSHFLIGEMCKDSPERRGSPEMYKYKGLSIKVDPKSKALEKTIFVRIGVLEAEFKINSCEKNSGCLAPEEERLIMMWMAQNENNYLLKSIFNPKVAKKEITILPFDLEQFFDKI